MRFIKQDSFLYDKPNNYLSDINNNNFYYFKEENKFHKLTPIKKNEKLFSKVSSHKHLPVNNKNIIFRNYKFDLQNNMMKNECHFTFKNLHPLKSGKNSFDNNQLNQKILLPKIGKQSASNNNVLETLQQEDNSYYKMSQNVDDSMASGKSVVDSSSLRRSPYYFNEPKYSKFHNSVNNSKHENSMLKDF